MKEETIIAPMDNQTLMWLTQCISSAPNEDSLDGILVTLEWFYGIDKDFSSFSVLVELINQKKNELQ